MVGVHQWDRIGRPICHDGPVTGRIVVVGEALVDLVIRPDGSVAAALGGAPFNTARTCGRLGVPVSFIGSLGDDRFGRMLRHALEDDGVDVSAAPVLERPTTLAAAELDERGAATYRFYLEGTSAPALGRVGPLGPDVSMVYTGGLSLVLEPMADAVAAMVNAISRRTDGQRPVVMVDVNARPHVIEDRHRYLERLREVLAATDVVKVSDDDLAVIRPGVETLDAARGLLECGPSAVLLTAGAGEVVVLLRRGSEDESGFDVVERRLPVSPVEVVDTIGAGDAFGGAVAAWCVQSGLRRADLVGAVGVRSDPTTDGGDGGAAALVVDRLIAAVRAGIAVAGVVCGRRGADPPTVEELRQVAPESWPTTR